ncbi:MAG: PPC domain-containing protein [Pirellulales bacterium]
MLRLVALFPALCTLALAQSAAAQAPVLTHTLPYGVAPGATTSLRCFGEGLVEPLVLWTNIPGAKAQPVAASKGDAGDKKNADKVDAKPDPKRTVFELSVPQETVPGIYGVRITSAAGATNLRLIMVDDLPTVAEDTSNKSVSKAQALSLPCAVDGLCEPESYDYYKFTAAAGQRISVEAVAQRLGSALDPVVRLLDAAGHELAYADDDESTGPDGRFSYRIQKAGEYFLEIRDIRYAGGGSHRYRLRVGDFPLLAAPYPMGVQAGTTSLVEAVGYDVGALEPLKTKVAGDYAAKQLPVAAKYAKGQGSGFSLLSIARGAEQTESEPNNGHDSAAPLTPSGAINGRFDEPKDRDFYKFEAKKGQRIRFVGRTRGFGSPADLYLRLLDKDVKVVAEAEDAGLEEGVLDYTFPADGEYVLRVEELLARGGPHFTYRIEIEESQPSFTLAIDVAKFDAPHAGTAKGKVTAVRSGFAGPINLKLEFLGDARGITAAGTIPEGKNDGVLTVTVPKDLPQGAVVEARVVGEGKTKDGKQTLTATASAVAALRTALGGLSNPPVDLAEVLPISVGAPVPDFIKFTTSAKTVILPQLVGKGSLTVTVQKLNKFDAPIKLAIEGLPAGVSAKIDAIEKGKTETTIEFTTSRTAAPLDQTFRLTASAVLVDQPKTFVVDDLTLRIAPPVEAQFTAPAALVPGSKQPLKIALTRHAKAAPITLRWKTLPPGVTGAKEWKVEADKTSGDTELVVDAKAALGPSVGRLTAITEVDGRTAVVDLEPIELIVAGADTKPVAKPDPAKPAAEKSTGPKQTAAK